MTDQVCFVRLTLRHLEPGGVSEPALPLGRPQNDEDRQGANLPIARDHIGQPHLPPTTVAGGLRSLLRSADPGLADGLMGYVRGAFRGSGQPASAAASQIWVLGTRFLGEDTRDRHQTTAIDRHRGAAAAGTLRSAEVLPTGTRWRVWLRWDDPDQAPLARILSMLARWRPLVGRSVSSGHGRCAVDELHHGTLDLRLDHGLLTYLTLNGPDLADRVVTTEESLSNDDAQVSAKHRIQCTIVDALHVGSGDHSDGSDGEPKKNLLLRRAGRLVVPGTTVKGVLRSRVEFILRSVGVAACDAGRCGTCWTCGVFGHGGGQHSGTDSVGARARMRALDAPIAQAEEANRTHVAINRLTGGAEDKLLFTDEVVESGKFTIVVEDIGLDGAQRDLLAALLRLVVQDLNEGLVTIGRAGTRGYGRVEVRDPDGDDAVLPTLGEAQQALQQLVSSEHVLAGRQDVV